MAQGVVGQRMQCLHWCKAAQRNARHTHAFSTFYKTLPVNAAAMLGSVPSAGLHSIDPIQSVFMGSCRAGCTAAHPEGVHRLILEARRAPACMLEWVLAIRLGFRV